MDSLIKLSINQKLEKEGLSVREEDALLMIYYGDEWLCTVTDWNAVNCIWAGWVHCKRTLIEKEQPAENPPMEVRANETN
jgi:hypothetical protein